VPSPQNREEVLYAAALGKPPAERAIFLDGACYGDPALRLRLEALLAARPELDQSPRAELPVVETTIKLDPADAKDEAVGKSIGRYKVLEKVGEGGCGVVYVAEQTEPVRRRVALKVIKVGMDTRQVIARFEAERQALAMMDHPNIAKVLDAGATETGRPYFVMELVRGIKITEYCDQANLTTNERLELFIKVCQAVQHAHQKGIIHRDIKPSNILVTLHDGVPVPKVIDFGIAKATTAQTLTEKTVYTELQQFIGTPAYMSPEQAEMSGLDIDTRADIYSLGVLLYELLVGRTPFDPYLLMVSGVDAMRKTLRENEPIRPSTRFATLKEQELMVAAKYRSAESSKVRQQLQGDLDWIVMKCLEKDRTRRYDTANGLAMDLKRHLDNEPVVARPPSAAYRFQKAFRRNKLAFAAGTAVVLALAVGLGLAAVGLRQAVKERDTAQAARADEEAQRRQAQQAQANETRLRREAEVQELAARRTAYNSDMNLVQQALAADNLGRARMVLDRQRPQPGQKDLRDWEWRYLWSQTRADEHQIFFSQTNRFLHPLSFSADGELLAWDIGGQTVVSDLISRRTVLLRTNAWRPVFAHRGTRMAFVEASATNDSIAFLDLATQTERRWETSWKITRWIGFTPDDRRLLTVSSRPGDEATEEVPYNLTALDVDTGRQFWQRGIGDPSTGNGRPYAISPDGAAFAAVLRGGRVQVLETQDGSERFTIKTTEDSTTVVTFSPDSSTLLTGAGYVDSAIRLWDARTGKATGLLEGHRSWVSDLLFTSDGKRLISSSGDQTIRLWDWSARKPAGVLHGHLDEVDGLALAPNDRTLASRCKDGSIYLWDVTRPSRNLGYQTLPSRLDSSSTVFTPDSRSILAADLNGGVALWDAFTLKETRRLWGDATNRIDTVISPDARWVLQCDDQGRLIVRDALSGLESTNFIAAPGRFDARITDNGKFLLTFYKTATNSVIEARETDCWQRKGFLTNHADWFLTTSLSNSFVMMADRTLQLFDVTRLDQAPKQFVTRGDVLGLATSPDGRTIVATYEDGSIRLWEMATLRQVATLRGFLLAATSVAFSPDSRRLAFGSSGSEAVKLWDAETLQEVLTLSGEESGFQGLQFSPDGRFLLAINGAGVAHLWSAPTWAEIEAAEADINKEPQR
jgi:WD40 repeat protein